MFCVQLLQLFVEGTSHIEGNFFHEFAFFVGNLYALISGCTRDMVPFKHRGKGTVIHVRSGILANAVQLKLSHCSCVEPGTCDYAVPFAYMSYIRTQD